MKFQTIIDSLPDGLWTDIPSLITKHRGHIQLTKNESRSLLGNVAAAIETRDTVLATNSLFAGLILDESRFLPKVQKDGLLRISRFSYEAEPLGSIVELLLTPELGLSDNVVTYLQSVSNLYRIAKSVREEYLELRSWLAKERELGIRGVIGTLDFLFLRRCYSHSGSDPSLSSRDSDFHSVEQLADGLSSILALYFAAFGPLRGNVAVDAAEILKGKYWDFLISGAHIAEFREWEFQIDRFGYRMTATERNTHFRLAAVSEDFHRAIEFGYIQSSMQKNAKSHLWHNRDATSFVDMGKELADRFMTYVEEPLPRFRFEFPEELFKMVADLKQFTREEEKTVAWACREMNVSAEDLFQFDFGNGVTINDLFRVSRIVSFMHGVAAEKLIHEAKTRPEVVLNSLVPAIQTGMLRAIVGEIVDEENVIDVIELLTMTPGRHIDVLYTPLIPATDTVFLPVHIFCQSDIFRNPLVVTQRRLFPDGTSDPLTRQVEASFKKAGAVVAHNIKYSESGCSGECDVIALLDGYLFVCECKNSLLPTGMHELRTSLDYIEKACSQLNQFVKCFDDAGFRKWLSREIQSDIKNDTRLVPSIIVSNRMFLGMRPDGFPVRGNEELEHFIERGTAELVDTRMPDDFSREICFWSGESLVVDDLVRFFEKDITYEPQWASLEASSSKFAFPDCVVEVPRYGMNMILLAGNFGFEDLKQELIEKAKLQGVPIDNDGRIVSGFDRANPTS